MRAVASKHLMLDARVVETREGVRLVPGRAEKELRNPLFGEDRPWETRFDNLYPNVVFDDCDGLYKCWYNPFVASPPEENTPPHQRDRIGYTDAGLFPREMAVCYARSVDGIVWQKPELGLVEFRGSAGNNIVLRHPRGADDDGVHGAGVFRDPQDPDPLRRYKMLFADGLKTMAVSFSPDGLHWSEPVPCPDIAAVGDTHNNVVRAPDQETYVGFTRLWKSGVWKHSIRVVGRTASPDFLHWTKAQAVFEGAGPQQQTYSMPVFHYGNVYLGLVSLIDVDADVVRCELAWSPDTLHWELACPGRDMVPLGPAGAYDCGCVYAAATPIVLGDEIRIYYAGSDGPHTTWRKGYLCLARLGRDRWAGYRPEPGNRTGIITTTPLVPAGGELTITADVEDGGWVRTALLDTAGQVIRRAAPLVTSGTDAALTWEDGTTAATTGRRLGRLQFELSSATLYSFGTGP